jgi:hypothetical protein
MIQTPLTRYLEKERSKAQWRIHRAAFAEARKRGANFHVATLAGFKATDEMNSTKRVDMFPKVSQSTKRGD